MYHRSKQPVDAPLPKSLKEAYNRVIFDSMYVMFVAIAAIFFLFSAVGLLEIAKPMSAVEILFDAAVFLAALATIWALRTHRILLNAAGAFVSGTFLVLHANLLATAHITNSNTVFRLIPFLVVAAGTILLTIPQLTIVLSAILLTGIAHICYMMHGIARIEMLLLLIPAAALCIAVFFGRRAIHRRVFQLRTADAESKSHLKLALDRAEKAFQDHMAADEAREKLEGQLLQVQKLEAVGVLAGGIAHGMNNLLGGISAYAALVLDDTEKNDPRRADIEEILSASARGAELTRNLLTFARKGRVKMSRMDLNDSVQEAMRMLESTLKKNLEITCRLTETLPPLKGDRNQISQVVMNLCINSAHAMKNGGKLDVETDLVAANDVPLTEEERSTGSYAVLRVRDTGCGMDENTLSHATEPFFTTKPQDDGTGLGLAMVYGTAKSHGGALQIESTPGVGTVVSVYFPVSASKRADSEIPPPPARPSDAQASPSYQTVLLVDDEPIIRSSAARLLRRLGCEVETAGNGAEALELYCGTEGPFDLVILDIAMPIMDGVECFKQLRQIAPDQMVVFSSGFSDEAQLSNLSADEKTAFMPKPYDMRQMAVLIHGAIPRT